MKEFLEIGPERNRHSRATRFSPEWLTMGLSSKNRDLDVIANMDERWPFEDCSFSVVFASHVLEHSAKPEHFIREAWRVLKPGGVCRMNVPSARWCAERYLQGGKFTLYHLIRNLRSCPISSEFHLKTHWHPYDEETLVQLFERGFYRILGGPEEPESKARLFRDVSICSPMHSRSEALRAQYFSSRSDRTIRCEGTK